MAFLVRSSCGRHRAGNSCQADECVNFGEEEPSASVSRLEDEEGKSEKMAAGPQAGQVKGLGPVHPDWLSLCGFVEGCALKTVTPCRTRARVRLANPPWPQAVWQQHWMTVWFQFMELSGWSPAIREGET